MMRMERTWGFGVLIFGLGCSVASASEGSTSTSSGAVRAATTDRPPSVPGDAPAPRGRPPQAAFDACKSRSAGDTCSVSEGGRTMNGTCRKGPNGEAELACAPAHPPGPPPEAVQACSGKAEGTTCSFTFDGRTMSGSCRKGPGPSDVIACAPPHPSGPPPGSNQSLSGSALARKLDHLEREIRGD